MSNTAEEEALQNARALAAGNQRRIITGLCMTLATKLAMCGGDEDAATEYYKAHPDEIVEQLKKLNGGQFPTGGSSPLVVDTTTASKLAETLLMSMYHMASVMLREEYPSSRNPSADLVPTVPSVARVQTIAPPLWSSLTSMEVPPELPFANREIGHCLDLEIVSLIDHRLDYDAVEVILLPEKEPLPLLIRFYGFCADPEEAHTTFAAGRCLTLREPLCCVGPLGEPHIAVECLRDVQWHSRGPHHTPASEELALASKALSNIALCCKKHGGWHACLENAFAALAVDDGNRKAYFFAATAISELVSVSAIDENGEYDPTRWEPFEAALWINWLYSLSESRCATGAERSAWLQEEAANWGPLLDLCDTRLAGADRTYSPHCVPFIGRMKTLIRSMSENFMFLFGGVDPTVAERRHSEGNAFFRNNDFDSAIFAFIDAVSGRLTPAFAQTALADVSNQVREKTTAFGGAFTTVGLLALRAIDFDTASNLLSQAAASMGLEPWSQVPYNKILRCSDSHLGGRGVQTRVPVAAEETIVKYLPAITPPTFEARFDSAGSDIRKKPLKETFFSADLGDVTEQEGLVAYINHRCVVDPVFALQVHALAPETHAADPTLYGPEGASRVAIDSSGHSWHHGITSDRRCALRAFTSGNAAMIRSILKANGLSTPPLTSVADREKALAKLPSNDRTAVRSVEAEQGTLTPLVGLGTWVAPALVKQHPTRANVRLDVALAPGRGPTCLVTSITALRDIQPGEELFVGVSSVIQPRLPVEWPLVADEKVRDDDPVPYEVLGVALSFAKLASETYLTIGEAPGLFQDGVAASYELWLPEGTLGSHEFIVDESTISLLYRAVYYDKHRTLRLHHSCDDQNLAAVSTLSSLERLDLGTLHSNGISDAGLLWLSTMTGLKHLKMSHFNVVTDRGLAWLATLTDLQHLDVSSCHLKDQGLMKLIELRDLRHLNISRCFIEDAGLAAVSSSLVKLQTLNINGCPRVTDAGIAPLAALTDLEALDFGNNDRITDAGLQPVTQLIKLRRLGCTYCGQITDVGLRSLSVLPSLQKLEIGCAVKHRHPDGVSDVGLASLSTFTALEELVLSNRCQLTDAGMQSLSGVANLRRLDLDHCHAVTEAGFRSLSRCSALAELNVSGNTAVTNAVLESLSGLTSLTKLKCCNCHISDRGIASVSRMTLLKHLVVSSTGITNDGLQMLSRTLVRLQQLDVSHTRVTDAGLVGLPGLLKLNHLNVSYCSVTDSGVASLAEMSSLRHLTMNYCDHITDVSLETLAANCDTLEHLKCEGCRNLTDDGMICLTTLASLRSVNVAGCSKITSESIESFSPSIDVDVWN